MATRKGWFDRMLKKFRDEGLDEERLDKMRDEAMHELPAEAFESGEGGDQHVHVHLHNGETQDDDAPPPDGGGDDGEARLAAIEMRLDKVESSLDALASAEEEEVELEDQDTQDKRRFKLRRGDAIRRTRDQDPPVPERDPEIVGVTDLPGTADLDKARTGDSAGMEATWQEALAAAEVIVPGYRMPTFDAKHTPILTAKRLCALRRGCLAEATRDAATADVLKRFTTGDVRRLPCDALKIAFVATADAIRAERNGGQVRRTADGAGGNQPPKVPTLAEMNRTARDHWAKGTGNGAVRH